MHYGPATHDSQDVYKIITANIYFIASKNWSKLPVSLLCAVCHPAQPEKDTNNHVLLVPAGSAGNEWAAMFGLIIKL